MQNLLSKNVFKNTNIIVLIITMIHFLICFYIIDNASLNTFISFGFLYKAFFIIEKSLSLFLILLFYKFIFSCSYSIRNKQLSSFAKHALIYFAICIVIYLLTYPFIMNDGWTYMGDGEITAISSYQFVSSDFTNWITGFLYIVFYNIIPNVYFIPVISMLIYSFIFAYIITSTKESISNKYANFLYVPFCIPLFLIYNHSAVRNIFFLWIFLFVISYIFFNQNKQQRTIFYSVIIGILSAVCAAYRMEYLSVIIILPLFIFFTKIFSKKSFIVFFIVLIFSFISIEKIQNIVGNPKMYTLHNLIFSYSNYVRNNNFDGFEEGKDILKNVYIDIEDPNKFWEQNINIDNNENNRISMLYIIKFTLEHSSFYIKNNVKESLTNVFFGDLESYPTNEKIENKYKQKILYILIPNPDTYNFLKIFYSPIIAYFFLIIMFIYGCIRKKAFYLFYTIMWCSALYTLLLFIPFYRYMLYHAFTYITYIFFSIMIISFLEQYKKHNEN